MWYLNTVKVVQLPNRGEKGGSRHLGEIIKNKRARQVKRSRTIQLPLPKDA